MVRHGRRVRFNRTRKIRSRVRGMISPPANANSGYRFPPEIIQHAIWLYIRFTLSFRDVEDLLAERGIMVSYETVRRWVNHFGPMVAADLRKRRPKPHSTWPDGLSVARRRRRGRGPRRAGQTRRNKRAALKSAVTSPRTRATPGPSAICRSASRNSATLSCGRATPPGRSPPMRRASD